MRDAFEQCAGGLTESVRLLKVLDVGATGGDRRLFGRVGMFTNESSCSHGHETRRYNQVKAEKGILVSSVAVDGDQRRSASALTVRNRSTAVAATRPAQTGTPNTKPRQAGRHRDLDPLPYARSDQRR